MWYFVWGVVALVFMLGVLSMLTGRKSWFESLLELIGAFVGAIVEGIADGLD